MATVSFMVDGAGAMGNGIQILYTQPEKDRIKQAHDAELVSDGLGGFTPESRARAKGQAARAIMQIVQKAIETLSNRMKAHERKFDAEIANIEQERDAPRPDFGEVV